MSKNIRSVITGTGSYIPKRGIPNDDFLRSVFYGEDGEIFEKPTAEIIDKFEEITGIEERRYVEDDQVASDIAVLAAEDALKSSGIDKDSIDCIIVAHNFGDVPSLGTKLDLVPSIASRVKHDLRIENPWTTAYDLIGSEDTLNWVTQELAPGGQNLVIGKGIDSTNPGAAYQAAENLLGPNIDRETLKQIVVTHNSQYVPCLAEKVKERLGIRNAIAYDNISACPGQVEGIIQATQYIMSGKAKRALVIGTETISKVADPHDMDSMIYADGAGATIVEGVETSKPVGILSHATRSDTLKHVDILWMDKSYNPNYGSDELFLKMNGNEVYKYALRTVPGVVEESLDRAGLLLEDVKKVFIHQANAKMDYAILKRLFSLYGIEDIPEHIMPMTISWLGNSSVATVPTLFDLATKGKLNNHGLNSGDVVVFASVGAGMNINSVVYRML